MGSQIINGKQVNRMVQGHEIYILLANDRDTTAIKYMQLSSKNSILPMLLHIYI